MIRLTPPVAGGHVMSGWGRPRGYRKGVHEGLDFDAKVGTQILAAADGTVTRVDNKNNSFAGKWIAISHGQGVITRYMHNKKNLVRVGDAVKRGQVIALLGRTGTSGKGKAHLHFDVKMLPVAYLEFVQEFGRPPGKQKKSKNSSRGVPAESLMDGAVYETKAKLRAQRQGVSFYRQAYYVERPKTKSQKQIGSIFDGIASWLNRYFGGK